MWESAAADRDGIVAGAYSAEVAADSAIAAPVAMVAPAESAGSATKAGSHSHRKNFGAYRGGAMPLNRLF